VIKKKACAIGYPGQTLGSAKTEKKKIAQVQRRVTISYKKKCDLTTFGSLYRIGGRRVCGIKTTTLS